MNYKKYRVYLDTPSAGYIVAASNTVNNLVALTKYWLTTTNAGVQLPPKTQGVLILQVLDESNGAYISGKRAPYTSKRDIITQLRKIGGR